MADIDALLDQLTLDEAAGLVSGDTAWSIPGCERLGIPGWAVSDGPIGVRGRGFSNRSLCLPSASAWSASWDRELVAAMGRAIAGEARYRSIAMVLGPTVNLHRHPLGGRHFECFSEDPLLTAETAVAYVEAVQGEGIGACLKHFVANDTEHQRHTISSDVDERTLRELYLPPFEAAVRAGLWGVMGAYNLVNGTQACEHRELLVDLLKGEWGFPGLVVTDWGALKGTVAPARDGCDLEMPGPGLFWGGGRLAEAVREGLVPDAALDDKVRRILAFLDWAGLLGTEGLGSEEHPVERPEDRALARRAAAAGAVLLRNEGGALPLDGPSLRTLAVVGPGATRTALLGGGSATVIPYRRTNVADELTERLPGVDVLVAPGDDIERAFAPFPDDAFVDGATVELFDGAEPAGDPVAVLTGRRPFNVWTGQNWPVAGTLLSLRATGTLTPTSGGTWRLGVAGGGSARVLLDGEVVVDSTEDFHMGIAVQRAASADVELEAGRPYELVVEVDAADDGERFLLVDFGGAPRARRRPGDLLDDAVDAARGADAAVVVVGTSEEYESEGEDRRTLALPGRQDELVRAVAAVNPRTVVVSNTGSPVLMPWVDDVAAVLQVWFPGQEGGAAVADVLLGDAEPGGRMPTTWPRRVEDTPAFTSYPGEAGHAAYAEGVFVGYRWYDARAIDPLWCFGHGLSYTTFEWGEPVVAVDDEGGILRRVELSVPVANTGDRPGTEVVQCYVAPLDPVVPRPAQELRAFSKLELAPGTSAVARLELGPGAFTRWGRGERGWVLDAGRYEVRLGASSRDIRAAVVVESELGTVRAVPGPA